MEIEEVFECQICNLAFSSAQNLAIHFESDQHIQKVEEEEGKEVEEMDFRFKKHKKKKNKRNSHSFHRVNPQEDEIVGNRYISTFFSPPNKY